jgi:V/A-type H+-transporting ATPase subunit K
MVKKTSFRKLLYVCAAAFAMMAIFAPVALAQEHAEGAAAHDVSLGAGIRAAGLAIGAGLAIMGGALGTARAQAAIGAGGTGAIAEKPELFANVLVLVAIPETIVVFGFVIAFFLLNAIG